MGNAFNKESILKFLLNDNSEKSIQGKKKVMTIIKIVLFGLILLYLVITTIIGNSREYDFSNYSTESEQIFTHDN